MTTEPALQTCPNCHADLHGQFCFACGQNQKAIDRHFLSLVNEALEDFVTPNSKAMRTLVAICFKPGFLTKEYFSGRKARYIQPIRLYFITSITFFFLASVFLTTPAASINQDGEAQPVDDAITLDIDEDDETFFSMDLGFLSPEDEQAFEAHVEAQIKKAIALVQEDPGLAQEKVFDAAPPLIFCLLPVFALLLKLTYLGSGRYYTEHLVLALHNHSFIFIAFLVSNVIDLLPPGNLKDWINAPVEIWTSLYLLLSLKVTFGEGWFKTISKFLLLGFCYGFLFLIAGIVTVIFGVLFL